MAKRKYAEGGRVSQGLRSQRANNNRGWEALDTSGRTEDEIYRRVGELRPRDVRRAFIPDDAIPLNVEVQRDAAEDVGGRLRRGPISDTRPRVGWKTGGPVKSSRPNRPVRSSPKTKAQSSQRRPKK